MVKSGRILPALQIRLRLDFPKVNPVQPYKKYMYM